MGAPFTSERPRRLCWNGHSAHFGMATPFGRNLHYFGLGVPVDKIRAFEAYEDAAAYDVRAQRMLGNCYYYGHGTKRNVEEAIHWYRKAAMHRDNYSLEMVNLYYTAHGGEEAEKWFETAAKIGGDQYGYASHMREYSKKAE